MPNGKQNAKAKATKKAKHPRIMKDGIDHINIYSKGETELGRLLSNFAHTPYVVDWMPPGGYKRFASVEAQWYWMLAIGYTPKTRNAIVNKGLAGTVAELRTLHGFAAKKAGREILKKTGRNHDPDSEGFQFDIRQAFWAKVKAHKNIEEMLRESILPFKHYYVYNGVKIDAGFKWQLKAWEKIRQQLKEGVLF